MNDYGVGSVRQVEIEVRFDVRLFSGKEISFLKTFKSQKCDLFVSFEQIERKVMADVVAFASQAVEDNLLCPPTDNNNNLPLSATFYPARNIESFGYQVVDIQRKEFLR